MIRSCPIARFATHIYTQNLWNLLTSMSARQISPAVFGIPTTWNRSGLRIKSVRDNQENLIPTGVHACFILLCLGSILPSIYGCHYTRDIHVYSKPSNRRHAPNRLRQPKQNGHKSISRPPSLLRCLPRVLQTEVGTGEMLDFTPTREDAKLVALQDRDIVSHCC